jgi:hypothetical protein
VAPERRKQETCFVLFFKMIFIHTVFFFFFFLRFIYLLLYVRIP